MKPPLDYEKMFDLRKFCLSHAISTFSVQNGVPHPTGNEAVEAAKLFEKYILGVVEE